MQDLNRDLIKAFPFFALCNASMTSNWDIAVSSASLLTVVSSGDGISCCSSEITSGVGVPNWVWGVAVVSGLYKPLNLFLKFCKTLCLSFDSTLINLQAQLAMGFAAFSPSVS